MKIKINLLVFTFAASMSTMTVNAVSYVVAGTNISDAVGDQVVVDNTGAVTSGSAVASLGYFGSILDPSAASRGSLAADFISLATSDFGETDPSVNGLFDITATIDTEAGSTFSDASGKDLYLFIGNASSLASSLYIGLVDIEMQLGPSTGPGPFETKINYSAGKFADGGSVVLGQISTNNVNFINGDNATFSTGSFELVAVPEPSSTALLGLGGLALIIRRRR